MTFSPYTRTILASLEKNSPGLFSYLKIARMQIQQAARTVDLSLARICATSGFLSSLYYAFLSPTYRRENRGTLYGRVRFSRIMKTATAPHYRLRRNIHRLEKGLIMRPRRPVFALDFIEETVNDFRTLVANQSFHGKNSVELLWGRDVLQSYFSVVGPHPTVEKARNLFQVAAHRSYAPECIPYARGEKQQSPVSIEQLRALSMQRRSVRWYLQQPVPRELVDQACEIAALAPSACNRQPFEFRIFDDSPGIATLNEIPLGTSGFKEGFPMLVVVVGHLWAYPKERDRHLIYIDGSLAAMSFMYALETLGLSSCPINWPDEPTQEKMMKERLRLCPDERVIMLISVGFADPKGFIPFSAKKELKIFRTYNS